MLAPVSCLRKCSNISRYLVYYCSYDGLTTVRGQRSIHVGQPPVVTVPSSINLKDVIGHVEQIPSAEKWQTSEDPSFRTLGNPPSLMSIYVPSSLPFYTRRGSLISIQGDTGSSITNTFSSLSAKNIIFNLLLGFPVVYQKIDSLSSLSLLVSSETSSNRPLPSLTSLTLDGRVDWAIFPKSSVHCYIGNALIIRPIWRSLKSIFTKKKVTSGLTSLKTLGVTYISGRGTIGLKGDGQIYQIKLKENEDIMLHGRSLLGMSVNSVKDVDSAISSFTLKKSESTSIKETEVDIQSNKLSPPLEIVHSEEYLSSLPSNTSWRLLSTKLLEGLKRILSYSQIILSTASKYILKSLYGNEGFVRISGPRVILIQSDSFKMGFPHLVRSDRGEVEKIENLLNLDKK